MSSRDKVGQPVRRTSWTGALGATLGRVLNVGDGEGSVAYVSFPRDGGAESPVGGPLGKVMVGKEGGE